MFDSGSGAVSGTVTITGISSATAVTLNDAFAGNNSTSIVSLTAGTSSWAIPTGTLLTTQQWTDFWAGKLYVLVTSSTFPQGEIRGQVLPSGVAVIFADVSPAMVVSPSTNAVGIPGIQVTSTNNLISGRAAVTVNSTSNMAAVNINLSAGTATGAQLLTGGFDTNGNSVAGISLATLNVDNTNPSHYMNESITLQASDVTNFTGNDWYVNVNTSANPSGEARGQVMTAPTLTSLQTNIFSTSCAGCHSGPSSNSLPSGQDLTSGHTYTSVVGVASIQQSTLKRIQPGDPENSYLVHKVEAWQTITGGQMPRGGHLTQAQIAMITAWVTAGAPNN